MTFPIGRVMATPGALAFCEENGINPTTILGRHVARDWSEMDREDQRANALALEEGSRVFSAYSYADRRVFVITEADRSVTTLLLADEY